MRSVAATCISADERLANSGSFGESPGGFLAAAAEASLGWIGSCFEQATPLSPRRHRGTSGVAAMPAPSGIIIKPQIGLCAQRVAAPTVLAFPVQGALLATEIVFS